MSGSETQRKEVVFPDQIIDLAFSFQRSRAFLTAYELGLFTALGDGKKSSEDLAVATGTEARATDRLLNALCALGLLHKKEGKFCNTAASSRFLVQGEPEYMESLMHIVHLWDIWGTLTKAVKKGGSVVRRRFNERGDGWLSAFIAAMHERARSHASEIIALLDLTGVSRVLDVGGGSGAYSMCFVKAKEGIKATLFDLPDVVPLSKGYIDQEGLSDKVELVSGNYTVDDVGTNFDLAFLSAIIHSNSYDQNQALINKVSKALNPGGQVIVQDFIMNEDRTSPTFGALFSLNMLVATEAGDTYTEDEVRSWMKKSGLSRIQRRDTRIGTTLIIGRKAE